MRHIHKKTLPWKKVALIVGVVLCGGALIFGVFVLSLIKDLPSLSQIGSRQVAQSTKIYDREGKVLLYEISGGEKRTLIPLDQIPQYVRDATITIEDEDFYNERGVSFRAITRAFFADLTSGHIVQGGSTITQQLAKNAFLSREQTLTRKIKEFVLAIQLDRHYSKDQILESYLNEVPYGLTTYGVESASQAYFGKSVKEISLGEAAVLAALLQAPSYYSPWGTHRDQLLARQQLVLKKMREAGKISADDLKKASAEKIVFVPLSNGLRAPHFVIAVQDYLVQRYGEELVRSGGLKVITTLDWRLQQVAERVVKEGATQNEKLYSGKNAALVAEDPKTGQILALVGSRDYFDMKNEGNFNVATQGLRQPGSALKPFVYLAAFEKGFTPETTLFDVPTEFASGIDACPPVPNYANESALCFHPENYSHTFVGPVSMRNALAQSINVPAVKTLYLAGLPNTLQTLSDFGVTTLNDPRRYGLTLTLGGGEVKMIELVGAYSVLAQEGVRHNQSKVLAVYDASGNSLESYADKNERVIDAQYPRLINDVLSDTEARAGLLQTSLHLTVFPEYDVALKTGTSNDYRDAWAMGYTPFLVAGVWAGNNDNSPMQRRGSSILAAIPIWHNFMQEALPLFPPEGFNKPDPTHPEKPVLRGDYLANKQIHTILSFVDKNHPAGPAPENPSNDPQFVNWEVGVLNWARANLPDFNAYNTAPLPEQGGGQAPPQITITAPAAGDFISDTIHLQARIDSSHPVTHITVAINGQVVKKIDGMFGAPYGLDVMLSGQNMQPQNTLVVEAEDSAGLRASAQVIVYK